MASDGSTLRGTISRAVFMALAVAAGSTAPCEAAAETAAATIGRYCAASWRNAGIRHQEWSDCTQEAVCRLLARVERSGLAPAIDDPSSHERRELNRAIWATIQRHRRAARLASLPRDVSDPRCQADPAGSEAIDHLATALAGLRPRQRRILRMWSEGWSVGEIAAELGLPAARVSDLKYKAISSLRSRLSA